ncbi:MAG: hypothetical protein ACFFC1_20290 [Promethearchaeota archaeon]
MSLIIEYDPNCSSVPNRVINKIESANTPDYEEGNYLINPDISLLDGIVLIKYWKVVSNNIQEMTQEEKDLIDNNYICEPMKIGEKKYNVKEYLPGKRLSKDTWYNKNDASEYSEKVEEIIYSYQGSKLTQHVKTVYYLTGEISSQETYEYYKDGNKIIMKLVE